VSKNEAEAEMRKYERRKFPFLDKKIDCQWLERQSTH
jgi:hypothetical protein